NLDVIKVADYVIDMGPEGGHRGGLVVAKGSPEDIVKSKESITGKYLKEELNRRSKIMHWLLCFYSHPTFKKTLSKQTKLYFLNSLVFKIIK
ncbi:MAG: hypothetical protein IPK03_11290, partial [Bacteroidetes bacterium]|nr:hypothetical protein [Bacteroidota bacterium]